MNQQLFISVICPVFNESKYIDLFIGSILHQDYDLAKIEVILVDGMSTDNTRSRVNQYCEKYSFLKLLENREQIVPYAMNIGIRESIGEYIIRLDAHSVYPSNYISKLIEYAQYTNSDNIGGICKTDVKNKNPKSLAIVEVLGNKFGVGNSSFRIGANKITEVDTVPFGCFKRNVFDRFGYYDERLARNQDIELNKRILRGGGKIYLIPEIECTYFARETFKGLMENNFQNGYWNILTVYYTKTMNSLSLRHFIPLLFTLSLIVPPLSALVYYPLIFISFATFVLYSFLIFVISFHLSRKKKLSILYLLLSFFLLHFSYGAGSLVALLKLPFLKK